MTILTALLLVPAALAAQDDPAAIKKRILEKVSARLSQERAALLKRIEAIIDEELARPAAQAEGDKAVQELERKVRALEEQKERAAEELAMAKRFAADEALRAEAKKSGPHDLEGAQEMFDDALQLHDKQKNFAESTVMFKKIYYQFPKQSIGVTAAYNVACGYALWGKKDEALDWLELSVKSGFAKIDHVRQDPDLDGLRNEKRYRRLLTDR